jgi:hypothetical protein
MRAWRPAPKHLDSESHAASFVLRWRRYDCSNKYPAGKPPTGELGISYTGILVHGRSAVVSIAGTRYLTFALTLTWRLSWPKR